MTRIERTIVMMLGWKIMSETTFNEFLLLVAYFVHPKRLVSFVEVVYIRIVLVGKSIPKS